MIRLPLNYWLLKLDSLVFLGKWDQAGWWLEASLQLWSEGPGVRSSALKLFTECLHLGSWPEMPPNTPCPLVCRDLGLCTHQWCQTSWGCHEDIEVPCGCPDKQQLSAHLVTTACVLPTTGCPELPWKPQLGTGDSRMVTLPVFGAHGPPGGSREHLEHGVLATHTDWPAHRKTGH